MGTGSQYFDGEQDPDINIVLSNHPQSRSHLYLSDDCWMVPNAHAPNSLPNKEHKLIYNSVSPLKCCMLRNNKGALFSIKL